VIDHIPKKIDMINWFLKLAYHIPKKYMIEWFP
jgi:hypothetical protein